MLNTPSPPVEQFHVSGSHFEVGLAIGRRFAAQIRQLFSTYVFFRQELLPYHQTEAGQARYHQFLQINQTRYPNYVAELRGMAQGAGLPFDQLFLLNLRGEYRDYFYRQHTGGCSDCCILTDQTALIGHNEDGDPEFKDNLYLLHVQVDGKPAFTALTYPGFLCGNALGFNDHGICFTVNNVCPLNTRPGVGRHFVARSLLESTSLDDAVQRATVPDQSSGFNYNIGDCAARQIINVETAPGAFATRQIRGGFFHANHYQALPQVEQFVEPSSQARLDTWRANWHNSPPASAAGVLEILGNQSNQTLPIYRSGAAPDTLATFFTALFDLDRRSLRIYTAHPARHPNQFVEFTC
ncbi:MAG: hypothetical protein D6768_15990 [Chloroflexi bacterium]|nr:MAG: hypothetical protein D6768_15990 [Chloroflexota bacterium]